jgi:sirohydrochlorin cobaltochelatase
VDQGCQRVTVVPLFLGAGGHVRKDLPLLMAQLQAQHPGVEWTLAPAVGETDILVQALADAAAYLADRSTASP